MKNQHLFITKISRKDRKEAKSAKDVMLSISETSHLNKRLILRSFAYAQDDVTEMCGAGKTKRAGGKKLSSYLGYQVVCIHDTSTTSRPESLRGETDNMTTPFTFWVLSFAF